MKSSFFRLLCLVLYFCHAQSLLSLNSKYVENGTAPSLPDSRKMIEDLLSHPDQKSSLNWPDNGSIYVLEEDPISRQLQLKSNTKPTPLPELEKTYALDIKDLYNLDCYLKNLRDHLKGKVFGDVALQPGSNLLDRGFVFYKDLNNIRDRYYANRSKIDQKAEYLKKVADFALEYTKQAKQTDLVNILSEKDVDIDEYNRFILTQLLERLAEEMTAFYKEITESLPKYFAEFDQVAKDKDLPVYLIIEKSSQISFKLVSLEQLELEERVDRMIKIRQLILDNRYYHHISASFDKELAVGNFARRVISIAFSVVICLFLVCF